MVLNDVELRAAINAPLQGAQPLRVRIIRTIDELTAADRTNLETNGVSITTDLDGFVSGNELVVNRANINTRAQAEVFAAHELLGHVGLRARYGGRLNQVLDQYFGQLGGLDGVIQAGEQLGVSLRDQYPELVRRARGGLDRNARRALVQEVFAAGAEAEFLNPGSAISNGVSDFVSRTKGFLARFPLVGSLFNNLSQRDIMRIVRESARAARQFNADGTTDIATAASIRSVASRIVGLNQGDVAIVGANGSRRVTKKEARGISPDGSPVRLPNEQFTSSQPIHEASEAIKQQARNAYQGVVGGFVGQVDLNRNPLTRGPSEGNIRNFANQSELRTNLTQKLADSKERNRVATRNIRKAFNGKTELISSLRNDINDRLFALAGKPPKNAEAGSREAVEYAERVSLANTVTEHLQEVTDGTNDLDFLDDISVHDKSVTFLSRAVEYIRDRIYQLDSEIDDAVLVLQRRIGAATSDEALQSLSGVANFLTTVEKNNAAFYSSAKLTKEGTVLRDALMERLTRINNSQNRLSKPVADAMRAELEAIVNTHFDGKGDVQSARLEANTTGFTTAVAEAELQAAGVSATDYGVYQEGLEALQKMSAIATETRSDQLPAAYFNERLLYDIQHDFPAGTVDLEKFPLFVNQYTQQGLNSFSSDVERGSQYTDDIVMNVRVQALNAARDREYNRSVVKSLLLSTLAADGNNAFKLAANNHYTTKSIRVVSKNSTEYRKLSTQQEAGQTAKNKFAYAVPNGNAAVIIEFDNTSTTPAAIRGDRKLEQYRQFAALRATRWTTGVMSRFMTQYNANFIPRSHVREFLIGGLSIAADEGLGALGSYLSNSLDNNAHASDVYNFMRLRNEATPEAQRQLQELIRNSSTAQELQDLASEGGLITQRAALSDPGQAGIARRGTSALSRAGQVADNYIGSLSDTTDAVVRLSAYQTQLRQGRTKQQAAVYAKRLANFEARGEFGGIVGDAIMFYNPTSVGAARVLESLFEGEYARPMLMASVGAGMAFGLAAAALSPEDEFGEKFFDHEGLDRQTTDIRIPINGTTTVSIPAGFQVGSVGFLIGNQLAGFLRGRQDLSQLAANSYEVLTNNFSPVPASGIPLVDSQGQVNVFKHIGDTITPSAARPVMQFFANMNGLGLPIYRTGNGNAAGGLTDAFNGRESDVGSWAERIAITMHNGGVADVNPGTLRHFMSSYLNGINAVLDFGAEAYNISDGVEAGHNFVDRSLGFGGFFSRKGYVDDYYQERRQLLATSKQLKTYEAQGRTELAQNLRATLSADFDEIITAVNRNKRQQDLVNAEMRPIIYGADPNTGGRRDAIDVQNERRRLLQNDGLALIRRGLGET